MARAWRGPVASLVLVACAGAACAGLPLQDTDEDDEFRLTVLAARTAYAPDEPISLGARLEYVGAGASVELGHSGSGPVLIALEQLDGPFDPGGGGNDMCAHSTIHRGQPLDVPYAKSGGWSGDDPLAGAYQAFFDDPLVRLGAGTYRFTAYADVSVPTCGGERHELEASLIVVVGGGSGQPLDLPSGGEAR